MIVMDILGFGDPAKAAVILNGIERKWGKGGGFKILRRETAIRVICAKTSVVAEIYGWVIAHQFFGNESQIHTTKRDELDFPEMNWGQA